MFCCTFIWLIFRKVSYVFLSYGNVRMLLAFGLTTLAILLPSVSVRLLFSYPVLTSDGALYSSLDPVLPKHNFLQGQHGTIKVMILVIISFEVNRINLFLKVRKCFVYRVLPPPLGWGVTEFSAPVSRAVSFCWSWDYFFALFISLCLLSI